MRTVFGAICFVFAGLAWGQASEIAHPDAATEQRLKALAEELRCLVCQNQTIADSSAPLAVDLRNQIRGQISQGRSDEQIRGYMVERYGDFVLYRPPFHANTALLWLGPFVLLAIGGGAFWIVLRRRRAAHFARGDARGTTQGHRGAARRARRMMRVEGAGPQAGSSVSAPRGRLGRVGIDVAQRLGDVASRRSGEARQVLLARPEDVLLRAPHADRCYHAGGTVADRSADAADPRTELATVDGIGRARVSPSRSCSMSLRRVSVSGV